MGRVTPGAATGWSRAGISSAMTLNFIVMGLGAFGWGSPDCLRRRASLVFNQHGITKLVSAVAARGRERGDAAEGCVVSECLQELKVAVASLMHARQDRIDNAARPIRPLATR